MRSDEPNHKAETELLPANPPPPAAAAEDAIQAAHLMADTYMSLRTAVETTRAGDRRTALVRLAAHWGDLAAEANRLATEILFLYENSSTGDEG
jgi:hypothetical protein